MYTGGDFGGEMSWSRQTPGDLAAVAQYDAKENFELYLKSVESFKENGSETTNGIKTVRYDGIISEDALKDVMNSTGVLSQPDSVGGRFLRRFWIPLSNSAYSRIKPCPRKERCRHSHTYD